MPIEKLTGIVLLVVAQGLLGCSGRSTEASAVPLPTAPAAVSTGPTLIVFAEPRTGFSTTDVRDVQEQILQFNTSNELIWTVDGTRLPASGPKTASAELT
jgi:hypothetical protein